MPLFGKKSAKKSTTLFFATDVHGSERTYRKFVNAGKFYNANVLVMGGDIIGKLADPDHHRRRRALPGHAAGHARAPGE